MKKHKGGKGASRVVPKGARKQKKHPKRGVSGKSTPLKGRGSY